MAGPALPRGAPATVPEIPAPEDLVTGVPSSSSRHWHACGPPPRAVQGWKLYVPLTLLNAAELTRALVPMIVGSGHHVKYVRDILTLRKLNAGMFGYPQIGKCLVVYLPAPDADLLDGLVRVLLPYRDACPAVPCARPFGDRLPLYYRYGSYRDAHLTLGARQIVDDRASLAGAVPDGVTDLIAPFTRAVPAEPAVASFLRRYPVLRALGQQGKCGVFHAFDADAPSFREVALKVGYHRGQLQPDGSDGNSFLRRELATYRLLADRGIEHLAAPLLDVLDAPRTVALVLGFVRGRSLLEHRLAGTLTVGHLQRAWEMLDAFHGHGVLVGDAKIANVLVDHDGSLQFVDFEGAGEFGEELPPVLTFFVDDAPSAPTSMDRAHFIASVLFPYERGKYSWADRTVSLPALAADAPDDDVSAWARARLPEV